RLEQTEVGIDQPNGEVDRSFPHRFAGFGCERKDARAGQRITTRITELQPGKGHAVVLPGEIRRAGFETQPQGAAVLYLQAALYIGMLEIAGAVDLYIGAALEGVGKAGQAAQGADVQALAFHVEIPEAGSDAAGQFKPLAIFAGDVELFEVKLRRV